MDVNLLLLGVLVSCVGMGLFIYGKKAIRWPHLAVGMAMMLLPFVVYRVLWLFVISLALLALVWLLRER